MDREDHKSPCGLDLAKGALEFSNGTSDPISNCSESVSIIFYAPRPHHEQSPE